MEETKTFADFAISEALLQAIGDMGFEEPTPIQAMAIPQILEGKDVTGQAQTGTGKTAAFGIPIIERLDPNNKNIQAIVLSPTRELAIQTAEEFSLLMKYKTGLTVVPIYGGQPIDRQLRALKGNVQVVIGTPGRVIDHIKRGTLRLDSVKMFVLDEADQMLDMGFREDIEDIIRVTPKDRQTILFSATMPQPILEITKRFQHDPHFLKITCKELTVPQVEQTYIEVRDRDKLEALCRTLDINNPELALVFCNTKRTVDDLMSRMQARGYFVEALHGDMKQQQRDRVMARFRTGSIDVLIATDVAARGIDVDDVDIVFNYDVPQDVEYYVHRIGRTARAGRAGKSVTFVSPREIYKLRDIQRFAKILIAKTPLPTLDDVAEMKQQIFLDKVRNIMSAGNLDIYLPLVEQLLETENETDSESTAEVTSIQVAAALLKMHLDSGKNAGQSEDIKPLQPSPSFSEKVSPGTVEKSGAEAGMVRFRISLGKNQQIRPKDIVGAFAGECDIPGSAIGRIDLYNNYSYVDIPLEHANLVGEVMGSKTIRGQELEISIAAARTPEEEEQERDQNKNGDRRGGSSGGSSGGYRSGGSSSSGGDRRGGSSGGYRSGGSSSSGGDRRGGSSGGYRSGGSSSSGGDRRSYGSSGSSGGSDRRGPSRGSSGPAAPRRDSGHGYYGRD